MDPGRLEGGGGPWPGAAEGGRLPPIGGGGGGPPGAAEGGLLPPMGGGGGVPAPVGTRFDRTRTPPFSVGLLFPMAEVARGGGALPAPGGGPLNEDLEGEAVAALGGGGGGVGAGSSAPA